jgi:hypothetical protein
MSEGPPDDDFRTPKSAVNILNLLGALFTIIYTIVPVA